jgi:hypothetical protein
LWRQGRGELSTGILVGETEGKNILYDLNADGNIIVKWKRKEENILRQAC